MCLLVACFETERDLPLIIAANRDERYDRPATPVFRRGDSPRILAGRDELAGGTWLAVNEFGVVAGLTNRPANQGFDPTRRSRGEIPLLLARHARAGLAVQEILQLDARDYNPCWLLVGDAHSLYALEIAESVHVTELSPGRHVLENAPLSTPTPKTRHIHELLDKLPSDLPAAMLIEGFEALLSDHELPATHAGEDSLARQRSACVHLDGFGTRSSVIVLVGSETVPPQVLATDGPPCQSEFLDVTGRFFA